MQKDKSSHLGSRQSDTKITPVLYRLFISQRCGRSVTAEKGPLAWIK
jgi:hypothetical protein